MQKACNARALQANMPNILPDVFKKVLVTNA
jgi:hypothetical protein